MAGATRTRVDEQRKWVVIGTPDQHAHILPIRGDAVAGEHILSALCWCQPVMSRDRPLDDGLVVHRQPDWPGSHVGWVS